MKGQGNTKPPMFHSYTEAFQFILGKAYNIRLYLIPLYLCIGHQAFSQIKPNFNNYLYNYYIINPAVAGIEDYVDIKTSIRSQWTGMEGAPETLVFTVHGNIESQSKRNPANPVKPKINPLDEYTVDLDGYNARPHHGIGGIVEADRIGPFSKMRFNGSYAYHIPLSKKYRLSAGLSLGMIRTNLDHSKITLQDPNDVAISGEQYSNTNPDLGLGLWFYSRSLFIGISGDQLFKYNMSFGEYIQSEKESYRNYNLTGGHKFYAGYEVIIIPSVTMNWIPPQPVVIDYNLVFSFINRVSVGLTYRSNNEFVLSSRFIANPWFELGYAFDYGGAAVDRYNTGSHELYLGLRLRNKNKILCPVNL